MIYSIKHFTDSIYTNAGDYVPILSTFKGCSNIIHTIFQKTTQGQDSKQINAQSVAFQRARAWIMLVPVIGNIALLVFDLIGRKKSQESVQQILPPVQSHENLPPQPSTQPLQANEGDVSTKEQSMPTIVIKEMSCEEEDRLDEKTNQEEAKIENKLPKDLVAAWNKVKIHQLKKNLSDFDVIKKMLKILHEKVLSKKQHVKAIPKKSLLNTLDHLVAQRICILKRRKHKNQINKSIQEVIDHLESSSSLYNFGHPSSELASLIENGNLNLEKLYEDNRLGQVAFRAAQWGKVDFIKGLVKLGNEGRIRSEATTNATPSSNVAATETMKAFVKFFYEGKNRISIFPDRKTSTIRVYFGGNVIFNFLETVANTDWNVVFPTLNSSQSTNTSKTQEIPLTELEKQAIRFYAGNDFVGINAFLRGQYSALMRELSSGLNKLRTINDIIYYSIALLSGLSKLSPTNSNEYVWRGEMLYDYPYNEEYYDKLSEVIHNRRYQVMKDRLATQKENLPERTGAPTSTSKSCLSSKMNSNSISLIKANLIGRDISAFSGFSWEKEVLIPPTNILYTYYKKLGGVHFFIGKAV